MQSVVYGYGGLRILAGMVRFRPTPMDNGAVYTLDKVKYAGWALSLEVGPEHVTLTVSHWLGSRASHNQMKVII
jgi:hypothetical protein